MTELLVLLVATFIGTVGLIMLIKNAEGWHRKLKKAMKDNPMVRPCTCSLGLEHCVSKIEYKGGVARRTNIWKCGKHVDYKKTIDELRQKNLNEQLARKYDPSKSIPPSDKEIDRFLNESPEDWYKRKNREFFMKYGEDSGGGSSTRKRSYGGGTRRKSGGGSSGSNSPSVCNNQGTGM